MQSQCHLWCRRAGSRHRCSLLGLSVYARFEQNGQRSTNEAVDVRRESPPVLLHPRRESWSPREDTDGRSGVELTSSFAVLYTTGRQEYRHIVWRVYTRHELLPCPTPRHELLQVLAEACVQGVDMDSASKCTQPVFTVLVAHLPLHPPPPRRGKPSSCSALSGFHHLVGLVSHAHFGAAVHCLASTHA